MNEDQKLRGALRAWDVETPAPDRFQAKVWARIRERDDARSRGGFGAWWHSIFQTGASWRFATASALVLALAGIGLGTASAASANERQRTELQRRYVRSVDPYLKLASDSAR